MTDALIRATLKTWPFDREPLDCGVEDGIVWAIVPAPYCGINGYVVIPAEGHPWSPGFPGGYDEMPLDVHGGVTYYEHPWVGFDTCHSGDVWTGEYDRRGWSADIHSGTPWDRTWTPELVAEEARGLARQIAEIGRLEKQLEIQEETVVQES